VVVGPTIQEQECGLKPWGICGELGGTHPLTCGPIRQHTKAGRPLRDEPVIGHVEQLLDRRLKKQKPEPPRQS